MGYAMNIITNTKLNEVSVSSESNKDVTAGTHPDSLRLAVGTTKRDLLG